MLTLPIDFKNTIESEIAFTCYMYEMDTSSSKLLYVNIDSEVYYEGNNYIPYSFDINAVNLSIGDSVQSITIVFDAVRTDLVSIVLNEDLRGYDASLWFTALDNNLKVIGRINLFSGIISGIDLSDTRLEFTLMDETYRWMETNSNIHSPLCQWRFKDPKTCKYSGNATWCDKTYDRCKYLGNTYHFRGFIFLPKLQEKEIWWGRTPK